MGIRQFVVCLAGLGMALFAGVAASAETEELAKGFVAPPDSARPWVYWFWLNGNITREGITADLEAMKRAGIGGVLIMEVDQGAPVGPVDFMGTQWRELFKHVAAEAQRLGLEVNMNDDAGWNGSGGPWITPELSMQKVVWSETPLEGPQKFTGKLAQPETVAGYYRDIEVLAVPTPGAYRIADIQGKACCQVGFPGAPSTESVPAEMVIGRGRAVDLTAQMGQDGTLSWDVPAGKWTILRFGHTSTGAQNAPAPATGRGLECDKLSKEGSAASFSGMMAKLIADVGPLAGKSLAATHIDSWENGAQNWTARMREEFRKRRGYDLLPFMPVMTGRVVESLEVSERFLWDLRQTVSELVVEYYAGNMRELASKKGLRLSIEAYGGPCDDAPYAGRADEPMAEFWIGGMALQTCKEMASAAHTYGKPILGAEAFTAGDGERWREHPATIKALGDQAMCDGVNRFVFHRYAMQPWASPTRAPGMTMGPWGLHYERTETWWELSKPWHSYLARCHYLLRQGLFVADSCYLNPEAAPQGYQGHDRHGYDFDNCSAEVLLTRMAVKDGRLVLPDGMSYRVLALPNAGAMTPPVLRKIKEFVAAGAKVVGPPPARSPSLTGYPECDQEVKRLADELWANGKIEAKMTPEQALAAMGVPPDFTSDGSLRYIHRQTGDADLYFVSNPRQGTVKAVAAFRVSGLRPELWQPETGRIKPAAAFSERDGVTRVALSLEPSGSVFVVFRKGAAAADPVVAMARDGEAIFSLAAPTPKIAIAKAVYGVPGDPQRSRDVSAKVQQLADAGERELQVSRLAEGDDPAFKVVKTLTVDYTAGKKPLSVTGKDGETVYLTDAAVKVVVDKVAYGVLDDPNRTRDLCAKVQQMVDAGQHSFLVAQLAAGDDPAFGVVKTAVVNYTIEGKQLTATGTDSETIDFATYDTTEPLAEFHSNSAGQLTLEAWQPGRYEWKTASGRTQRSDVAALPQPQAIAGPWQVAFDPKAGGPASVAFDKLEDWSKRPEDGIKYYSGAATYRTTFQAKAANPQSKVYLDLGKVAVMAEVKLNGRDLGILWKPPYRVDVTGVIIAGENTLEVSVVNLWINRQIGDEQMPEDSDRNPDGTLKAWPQWLLEGKPSPTGRFTFTSWRLWKKGDAPVESGLLGPVVLRTSQIVKTDK